ncbi:hypothetical protein TH61_15735 [Rufibacter sp. DG15C]|uniref:hypothetical protein n=1 Tax=Rufibacter sp. DG15C TaxID=1379909 RepID=UPI00078C3313|nr:hypothetical protein [Rufibacter sp. DG15C]AMM52350.1 hypothetical protein TH61_15735 [Rufibacter sp. DG15C]
MKILFVVVIGIFLGWLNAKWDVQGQKILALHQERINPAVVQKGNQVFCQIGKAWFSSPLIWPF